MTILRGPLDSVLIDKGHDPGLPTNQNVKALLRAHFGIPLAQTYATNLFPFIKPGKMTADVPPKELAEAARTYTVPEIEVVEPKLVVCCGSAVYRAIRKALGLTWAGNLEEAIESPFRFRDTEFWGQSHPGRKGRNYRNRGRVDRVSQDWQRMSKAFRSMLLGID